MNTEINIPLNQLNQIKDADGSTESQILRDLQLENMRYLNNPSNAIPCIPPTMTRFEIEEKENVPAIKYHSSSSQHHQEEEDEDEDDDEDAKSTTSNFSNASDYTKKQLQQQQKQKKNPVQNQVKKERIKREQHQRQ